jgi:lipopolysaccharide export system protein LptA
MTSGGRGSRRRGSGLLRGVVVAAATLAILLVCFSMYEFSESDRVAEKEVPRERLPNLPTELSEDEIDQLATGEGGVEVGTAKLGKAQEISISIYSREGTRAALEITVSDWVPRDGSDHEFTLRDPDIRMRTNDGNDVRVTATEGMLDARRKSAGGLDPRRGWLTGNVVIVFDRRTDADKAALSAEERDHPRPEDLVRIETETLEFDLEYDKLIVPGKLNLVASDLLFEADDLEIRFNEAESRVEAMRIGRGGSIELLGDGQGLGLTMPGADTPSPARTSIVEWIRASIESRLAQRDAPKGRAVVAPSEGGDLPEKTEDGVPIYRAGSDNEDDKPSRAPVRYLARFEDDVDVKQMSAGQTVSRLKADALEVLRDFGDREKKQVRSGSGSSGSDAKSPATSSPPSTGRIHLKWSGRLALDALGADHPRYQEGGRAKILAYGSPAELSGVDGEAVCTELSYTPDTSSLKLVGTEAIPVVVRSLTQGNLMGRSVSMRREGERFSIDMTGPGVVSGDMTGVAAGGVGAVGTGDGSIRFEKTLKARGRVVRRTVPDFTGTIRTIESRLLEEVVVTGNASVIREETGLNADRVEFAFGSRRGWQRDTQYLRRLRGLGNVVMTFGDDRTTSDEIDVSLAPTADGRSLPTVAVATGNVVAIQSERTLRASEKLVVDFTHVSKPVSEVEVSDAVVSSDQSAGVADSHGADSSGRLTAQASRLRAYGDVSVLDPAQGLDVTADRLDCTLADGRGIETANVFGSEGAPASVRTDTFSVVGGEIELDVAKERAKVPGPGRMTFQSQRDLDGGKSDQAVPIAITWEERMAYEGTSNVANFYGKVHAASDAHTTFDCDQLRAEFGDVVQKENPAKATEDWGVVGLLSESVGLTKSRGRAAIPGRMSSKELTSIHAWGDAVALTSEMNEATGMLKSRARLAGPKLSVNLRGEVSKMLIEGPGTLMLEDFEIPDPATVKETPQRGDLFGSSENSGPSKTLVSWKGLMWYDFSIDQVRFEEGVDLKHLSGKELQKAFPGSSKEGVELPAGRRTFLASDILTVDFRDRAEKSRDPSSRRMGRLASDQLRRFHASGNVDLQDTTDGLWLTAEDLVFERDRSILVIEGGTARKARIIKQEPGKLPTHVDGARFFYNLKTGRLDVSKPGVRGG